jgi:hypothetical protein
MALTHTIIETRQELSKHMAIIEVVDTVTGAVYVRRPMFRTDPSIAELNAQIAIEKERIQLEIDLYANDLNLTTDEDRLLGYYRGIKNDIILRVRQYPAATLQQAADYISGKYPDSPFAFSQLYQQWLSLSNCATWAQFKTFCIDRKFIGIDS